MLKKIPQLNQKDQQRQNHCQTNLNSVYSAEMRGKTTGFHRQEQHHTRTQYTTNNKNHKRAFAQKKSFCVRELSLIQQLRKTFIVTVLFPVFFFFLKYFLIKCFFSHIDGLMNTLACKWVPLAELIMKLNCH